MREREREREREEKIHVGGKIKNKKNERKEKKRKLDELEKWKLSDSHVLISIDALTRVHPSLIDYS